MTFTLINASAGSGKTHRLTAEIADRIAGGLLPSELIATTFTRRAAEELGDRVHRSLLAIGHAEDARGLDSAMIGTVNAVAGRLVREFALDAGISPDVREIDEDQQRLAFSAAIDIAAARAADTSAGLLARTEHDTPEVSDLPFPTGVSWRAQVRQLASRARSNAIPAEDLRAAADQSWVEYRDAALPAPGPDRRGAWVGGLRTAVADLRERAGAGDRAATTITGKLPSLEALLRTVSDTDRAPWSAWAKLASVARGAAAGDGKKYAWSRDVDAALLGVARSVDAELLAQPLLQDDVRDLIALVVHTAADSLDAYARHKAELGLLDFVDQEVLALRLLQESPRAREAVADRFRLLAVDEFQDTSPVQLALFLALSELVGDLLWVGDPKQAIYGFRDADPALMLQVLDRAGAGDTRLGAARIEDLEHSWRSQEDVLALVSAVFPVVFPDLPEHRVVLTAAPGAVERREQEGRPPGRLETWTPQYTGRASQPGHARAVADGVLGLLAEPGVEPEDVAVLVRTNTRARQVAAALAARGIPASGEGTGVLDTREGRLVRAALAVTLDRADTLALTELVDLLPDHPAHTTWFEDLAGAGDAEERAAVFAHWWAADVLAGLRALRTDGLALTPVETVTALVEALDLPEEARSRPGPEQRLRTLDTLRALAVSYADEARAASAPVTLTGFREALDAADRGPALDGVPGTVWVGTVHAAKGLEWSRVVVMLEAKETDRSHPAGTLVVPADRLDVLDPLAGRALRYWPHLLPRFPALQDALAPTAHGRRRARADREEAGRLQYVALTRARDVTVLSGHGSSAALDALLPDADDGADPAGGSDAHLLAFTPDGGEILVHGGVSLPARTLSTDAAEPDDAAPHRTGLPSPLAATDLPPGGVRPRPAPVPARFTASGVPSDGTLGHVGEPVRIGPPLVEGGGRDWDRVGEAVHSYLALPLAALSPARREAAADRLVDRWAVRRAVGPGTLLQAGQAWLDHLAATVPGAEVLTEQPITWRDEAGRTMQGWIDAILRAADGTVVLVDHKTYPGGDPVGRIRDHHLGQLDTYAQALAAAGTAPDRVLVHLPLRGEVVEVTLARSSPPTASGPRTGGLDA